MRFETVCDEKVIYALFDSDGNVVYSGESPNSPSMKLNSGGAAVRVNRISINGLQSPADKKEGVIGFRTIKLVRNPGTGGDPPDTR